LQQRNNKEGEKIFIEKRTWIGEAGLFSLARLMAVYGTITASFV
jgi:hypothetical protein